MDEKMILVEKMTPQEKELYKTIAKKLKGSERRLFKARIVNLFGRGGQIYAERELGWNRRTVRKACRELAKGVVQKDNFSARGRKRAEDHLPRLLQDIQQITESWHQSRFAFQETRNYRRITVKELRRQLITQKGYRDQELPSNATLNNKLNALGYRVRTAKTSQPLPKIPQTEMLFEQLQHVQSAQSTALHISCAAQAPLLIRALSRQGVRRVEVKALDRAFHPQNKITPFGILLPGENRLFLYFTQGRVTSEFMMDCIRACWQEVQGDFPTVTTLLLNQSEEALDHNHQRQFMKYLSQWAKNEKLTLQLDNLSSEQNWPDRLLGKEVLATK